MNLKGKKMNLKSERKLKKILVTGSSGTLGSALVALLKNQGYQVGCLKRIPNTAEPFWNIKSKQINLKDFTNPDVIIHLAGENIQHKRWTVRQKNRILTSRIDSTKLLANHIDNSTNKPSLFICASAIGFYGSSPHKILDEKSKRGEGFLSEVAAKWENATKLKSPQETRVVNLRTGIVLSKDGGLFAKMLPIFKLGLGGKLGDGNQMLSWIDIDDLLRAILFIITTPSLAGPINLVSPTPVTNIEFTKTFSSLLHRPAFFNLPQFAIKILFGEMGTELMLPSMDVSPKKLIDAKFKFEFDTLEKSLKHLLKKNNGVF